MKKVVFLIFFAVFFGIFFLGSYYVYIRGAEALSESQFLAFYKWVFWGLTVSFGVGQFLERGNPTLVGQIITYIGSFWLVILWYLFLFVIAIDLVRVTNHWFHYIPAEWTDTFLNGQNLFTAISSITLLMVIAGHLNALSPRIVHVDVNIDKPGNIQKEIKVALVTDIHMGHIIGNRRVAKLVSQLNNENPDLVLFGGDLVDHNPLPVIKNNMGEHFNRLNPPLGKYAITGNHEYIGKPDVSIDYLSSYGIQYIRDSIVNVNDILWIVGREDKDKARFIGENRLDVSQLINGEDKSKPIILMDHQPVEFDSVAKAGVDLMVSGHTHKGQFWPFGMITKRVYELDWGLKKKENTHFYVSSGYGTWGPPVRIGSKPEIVIFKLKLN